MKVTCFIFEHLYLKTVNCNILDKCIKRMVPPLGPLKKFWSPPLTTLKNSGPPHKQAPPLPGKNDNSLM